MRTSSLEMGQHLLSLFDDDKELTLVEKRTKRVLGVQKAIASHSKSRARSRDSDSLPISIPSEPECYAIYISLNSTDRGHSERQARI